MATRLFSQLANEGTFAFNPATDKLIFDNPSISASDVAIFTDESKIFFNSGLDNKEISLVADIARLNSVNVSFSDGSLLLIGDNKSGTSTAPDQGNNKLTGGTGNDHLMGLGGNDTLIGGKGNDYLEGGEGNDRLDGGDGVEFFFDFYGNNTFLGGAGNDFFFGYSDFSGGVNRATGGTGRDTYYAAGATPFSPVNFIVTDFATGSTGDNINISIALTSAAYQGYYDGQDPFTAGFIRVVQSGSDALVQVDLDGAAGSLFDFATSLTLQGANAVAAAGTVTGYVLGGAGNDNLLGNASNQILFSGTGNDVLNGGAGADNMFGGSGNDTYYVDDGGDVITESSNAPGGLVVGPGSETAAGDGFTDTVLASVNYSLESSVFIENLRLTGASAKEAKGNLLNNTITGNGLANRLEGLGGDDVLSGGAGADTVLGGEGNDRMIWGTGDTLNGEAGSDTLKLASGNLDLTTVANTKILGVERIDMIGGGNNILKLARADVLALSTESDTLTVLGNAGDKVDVVGTAHLDSNIGGFKTYSLGSGALLVVETDVNVI